MISTIKTARGRIIEYELRIRKGSNRIVQNDLKTVDAWLHQEATNEAQYYCDGYMAGIIHAMNPKKLSPADRDMLNDYLFGQEQVMLHNSAKE